MYDLFLQPTQPNNTSHAPPKHPSDPLRAHLLSTYRTLRHAFHSLDLDRDGHLTPSDLLRTAAAPVDARQLDRVFERWAAGGGGKMGYSEFTGWVLAGRGLQK
jgi:Ca2+-binding EF-hand superfamily protein